MYKFSDNIQRGILYLLKTDKDFLLQTLGLVEPDYFEYPAHGNFFKVIRDYHNEWHKLPADEHVIEECRKLKDKNEDIEDYEDELEEINSVDSSSIQNPDYYMDLVEQFARRERLKNAIRDSVELINEDKSEEIETVIREALMVGREIDLGQMYFSDIVDRWHRTLESGLQEKFKTILPSCNEEMEGGHNRKELCMVVAPPGVGKSLWLVNQSVMTLMEGKKVLYVSLEMSEDKIAKRFDSVMTRLPNSQLKEASMQLTLKDRLKIFRDKFPGSELVIKEFPTGQATVNDVRRLLLQLETHHEFKPDLIVVDYLELLLPIRKTELEHQAQQRVAEELRGLGMEHNALVWTATQTNRAGESVELITRRELGDSYGKIRTADWGISLNQTTEEYDNGVMRVYILKARDSKQRYVVHLKVDYNTLKMSEAEYGEQEATIQI